MDGLHRARWCSDRGGEGFVQVLEGLSDGDEVVTSAQFLIDSESNLREAINKLMSPRDHGGGS